MDSATASNFISALSDRHTRDLRYRQRQFISLHKWISKQSADLETAISADDGLSHSEARFIIALALKELRQAYDSLDLKQELEIEYRIKKGKDNEARRLPEELVYVIPETFTLFYSVVSVICACLAAGSGCLVEVCASQ